MAEGREQYVELVLGVPQIEVDPYFDFSKEQEPRVLRAPSKIAESAQYALAIIAGSVAEKVFTVVTGKHPDKLKHIQAEKGITPRIILSQVPVSHAAKIADQYATELQKLFELISTNAELVLTNSYPCKKD